MMLLLIWRGAGTRSSRPAARTEQLRFADGIALLGSSAETDIQLLDSLVAVLAGAALLLNPDKAVALTTEAQPSNYLGTEHGAHITNW